MVSAFGSAGDRREKRVFGSAALVVEAALDGMRRDATVAKGSKGKRSTT